MSRYLLLALWPLAACGGDEPCDPTAPGTICTIAGKSRTEGYAGDGGPATEATLYIPMDTLIGPDGNLWLMDFNNYVIRSIDSNGVIRTIIGNGELGSSPSSNMVAEYPALQSANNHTPAMMLHGDALYLAAWHESRIKRVRLADMMMENVGGNGSRTKYDGDGGPALNAAVDLPSSIAFDPAGNLVFTDQANEVIRMIDSEGTMHTIAGRCVIEERTCQNNGTTPVPCPGSNKFTCGDPATSCGGAAPCTQGFAGDGGPATEARFSMPGGQAADPTGRITYDHAGNLLFADTANHRIRRIDPAGIITTIAGNGTPGTGGDGGPATSAELNRPVDIAVADDDTLYIADTFNNCIRKVSPDGVISTVVGVCDGNPKARAFAGDGGPPQEAKLDRPYGIDLVGNKLYVCDSYNNRIRVVNFE